MARNTGQDFIIVGFIFVNSYVMQVQVSTLSDPPLQFMRSLLWELYELNFWYELYALDWFIVLHLWTTFNEAQTSHQTLIYSIVPSESGLCWI